MSTRRELAIKTVGEALRVASVGEDWFVRAESVVAALEALFGSTPPHCPICRGDYGQMCQVCNREYMCGGQPGKGCGRWWNKGSLRYWETMRCPICRGEFPPELAPMFSPVKIEEMIKTWEAGRPSKLHCGGEECRKGPDAEEHCDCVCSDRCGPSASWLDAKPEEAMTIITAKEELAKAEQRIQQLLSTTVSEKVYRNTVERLAHERNEVQVALDAALMKLRDIKERL